MPTLGYYLLPLPMGAARCQPLLHLLEERRWQPRRRTGVSRGISFSDTIFQGPLLDAARELLPREISSFTCLQVNRYDPIRWSHSEIHTDGGNYADSRMIVLGDFQGGAFVIYPHGLEAPPVRVHDRYQWIAFDGHLDHGSEPITSGIRFSVIAFTFDRDRELAM